MGSILTQYMLESLQIWSQCKIDSTVSVTCYPKQYIHELSNLSMDDFFDSQEPLSYFNIMVVVNSFFEQEANPNRTGTRIPPLDLVAFRESVLYYLRLIGRLSYSKTRRNLVALVSMEGSVPVQLDETQPRNQVENRYRKNF